MRLIDLNALEVVRPEDAIVAPASLLKGRMISLGIPDVTWLYERVGSKDDVGA